jgi:type IV pilus assembly protein PilC
MLIQVADFYEREAGYAVEAMTTLIEPAIIVFLGVVVGGIVASVMLPMFEMSTGATMGGG